MAQKDARIRFLERELAEREKEMETMKDLEQPPVQEADDERLRDLERKVRELEAIVKGLMEEVLDVKSVTMKILRDIDERRKAAAETKKAGLSLKAEPRIMAEPRPAHTADQKTPARQAAQRAPVPDPVDDRDLELIMQNDGTLRPEARRSSEYIVASTGSGIAAAKGRGKSGKPSERKLFVEQKKRPIDDVIQADEDDTVDLDR
ncbi:MAG: hypothetical protein GX837_06575 [Methanomicrobiales archaeon]|nr:hypothetical protein [Methanomicrobiales archaeon]